MLKLRLYGDPVLTLATNEVLIDDLPHILLSFDNIVDIMTRHGGIAIAANQVGICKRFFILNVDNIPTLFINPKILDTKDIKPFNEGCLSLPGTSAKINRAATIKVSYLDKDFQPQEQEFSGIFAVAIQHEIEHLDGKMYIDNLPTMEKLLKIKQHKQYSR